MAKPCAQSILTIQYDKFGIKSWLVKLFGKSWLNLFFCAHELAAPMVFWHQGDKLNHSVLSKLYKKKYTVQLYDKARPLRQKC